MSFEHIYKKLLNSDNTCRCVGEIDAYLTWQWTYKEVKCTEILILNMCISHKKEIKVNRKTPDYCQNFKYPTNSSSNLTPMSQNRFKKTEICFRFYQKCFFLLSSIFSAFNLDTKSG